MSWIVEGDTRKGIHVQVDGTIITLDGCVYHYDELHHQHLLPFQLISKYNRRGGSVTLMQRRRDRALLKWMLNKLRSEGRRRGESTSYARQKFAACHRNERVSL